MAASFRRAAAHRLSPLFDRLFRAGRRLDSPRVQLVFAPAADPPGKIGYVIGAKHMPRAVDRNRLRRVLRETLRPKRSMLAGLDVVVRLRRGCDRAEVSSVVSETLALLDRLEGAGRP